MTDMLYGYAVFPFKYVCFLNVNEFKILNKNVHWYVIACNAIYFHHVYIMINCEYLFILFNKVTQVYTQGLSQACQGLGFKAL